MSGETRIEPDIRKVAGCTSSGIQSVILKDGCNGSMCLEVLVYAAGMHGTENWHFDFNNGKTLDTLTQGGNYAGTQPVCPVGQTFNGNCPNQCDQTSVNCNQGRVGFALAHATLVLNRWSSGNSLFVIFFSHREPIH